MNKTSRIIATAVATATLAIGAFAQEGPAPRLEPNPEAKLHRFSTTVEKERPKLNKETQDLIAAYRRDPSEANREALRRQVAANYDAVVARKKAKLEELKETAKHQSKIDEMQVIVDEMLRDREQRIEASMARFTDPRFRPGLRDMDDAYLPVLGAKGRNVSMGATPVTEAEWAKFKGTAVEPEKERLPVTGVSAYDAECYCAWLMGRDPAHTYRLPTEDEWELAAGHMPKDADFNCGVGDAVMAVDAFANTQGACGGTDFWGNCWEWTATGRGEGGRAVKGGAFDSKRTECRTEARVESRKADEGYPNVSFRVLREDRDPPPDFRDESPDAPPHARGRRGDRHGRLDLGDRPGRRGPPPEGVRHKPPRPEMDEDGTDAEDPRPRPPRKGHGKRRPPRPDDGEDDGDRP